MRAATTGRPVTQIDSARVITVSAVEDDELDVDDEDAEDAEDAEDDE